MEKQLTLPEGVGEGFRTGEVFETGLEARIKACQVKVVEGWLRTW